MTDVHNITIFSHVSTAVRGSQTMKSREGTYKNNRGRTIPQNRQIIVPIFWVLCKVSGFPHITKQWNTLESRVWRSSQSPDRNSNTSIWSWFHFIKLINHKSMNVYVTVYKTPSRISHTGKGELTSSSILLTNWATSNIGKRRNQTPYPGARWMLLTNWTTIHLNRSVSNMQCHH